MSSVGILVGGGPAPGINGVIHAASIHAARNGIRVLGFLDGFQWLMKGDTDHVRELGPDEVARIPLQGGSILRTSRANPTRKPEDLAQVVRSLEKLGVEQLITIGGDDTATSAQRVAEAAKGKLRVVHVPKTIDNDLPLPTGIPTFGFETAREHGSTVVERLLEDTRTTSRWFFVILMGRTAGHLALGVGKAAGATVVLIPEEFPEESIRLDDVVRVLEGSIVKRLALGRPDGVALIAEGIAERLDPKDLEVLEQVERDEHGHIRLADVPLGRVLSGAVTRSLADRGVPVRIGDKDVGYELRCGTPTAFDRDYTRDLGFGAVRALLAGESSVLITRQAARVVPIPFTELIDSATGRARVRTVDTNTDSYAAARAMQVRVEREDLENERTLAALAQAARLDPAEAKRRYAPR